MPDTPQPAPKDAAGEPGSVAEQPGASEGGHPPNNLPHRLSDLVGRWREIAEVEDLLAEHRLLTLTGPGGSGKTRLALAVAHEAVEDYEDGAWLVELAPISDPGLVAQAVASVLGVREQPGIPLFEMLVEHIGSSSILLVVDNCEHLVGASASLAEALLGRCPKLSMLVTSREALSVEGEALFVVPPLSLPDPRRLPALDILPDYEAVRLFVERARAVRPGFALSDQNAMAVAQICYRLDGMPLAIELAAARARVLSAQQIASRLEDSFALLKGGVRSTLAHHGTLRATMDWSYELLSEEERILFRRLSVFAGGFTLEAAEAVGASGDIAEGDILDLLSSLVDKSLVVFEERQDGMGRFRQLETVRQYSFERLEESGEEEQIRRQHAEYYLALAEGAEEQLKGISQQQWLDSMEIEHVNLRAAIGWALERRETELALRLTASAAHFRYPRGHLQEGRRQLEAALATDDGSSAPSARAKALTEAGFFALEQSDHERGEGRLEESLLLYRDLGDAYGVAHALECLAVAKTRLGDYGQATQLQEESLAIYREMEHKWGIAMSLNNLGIVALKQGHYERATTLHQESLALLRTLGDSLRIGDMLCFLGQEALAQGQLERSAELLEESQVLLRRVGDKPTLAVTLRSLAETVHRQGDDTRAADLYKESLKLAAEVGSKARVARGLEGLAELALTHGQPARAARLWAAAEAVRETMDGPVSAPDHFRLHYDSPLASVRSHLGEATFEAAWSEGRAMTQAEAVEYALGGEVAAARPPKDTSSLSEREMDVLRLVAQGLTNPQIASRLYLSPRTVGQHLRSIYRKLGVPSRAAAAKEASERSLI